MILHQALCFFFLFSWQVNCEDECVTSSNKEAKCVPINLCQTEPELLHNSSCNTNGTHQMVCCRSPLHSGELHNICGKHSDDYLPAAQGTQINEFPWLAVLEYKSKDTGAALPRSGYMCSGSLLSNRYILTSAVCVNIDSIEIVSARLGEYHFGNETDCIEIKGASKCSDATVDVGVEKIIVHPHYDLKNQMNDIALIKLNRSIDYSEYIRPICLPSPDVEAAHVDDTVVTSGWGLSISLSHVDIKAKTYSRIISSDECTHIYKNQGVDLTMSENRFCTLHLKNNTEIICRGDSGGPVMISEGNRWHQEGIVSAGPSACTAELPLIHTNVSFFLEWIHENMKD